MNRLWESLFITGCYKCLIFNFNDFPVVSRSKLAFDKWLNLKLYDLGLQKINGLHYFMLNTKKIVYILGQQYSGKVVFQYISNHLAQNAKYLSKSEIYCYAVYSI